MSSNVTSLADRAKKRQEERETEKVVRYERLDGLLTPESSMIMSIQHQLNFYAHNAMARFGELATDNSIEFVRLLELLREYYAGVFFPLEILHGMGIRHIDFVEKIDGQDVEQHDSSITVFSHDIADVPMANHGGEVKPMLSLDVRFSRSQMDNKRWNVDTKLLDIPHYDLVPDQYRALVRNIIKVHRENGGNSLVTPSGMLLCELPYSKATCILTILQLRDPITHKEEKKDA